MATLEENNRLAIAEGILQGTVCPECCCPADAGDKLKHNDLPHMNWCNVLRSFYGLPLVEGHLTKNKF